MAKIKLDIPHALAVDEARKRLEALLGYWSRKYNVKGTWAGFPHSAQTTSWSSFARPVPRTLRLIERQSGQREGSCWNPFAE